MRLKAAPVLLAMAALGACQTYVPVAPHPEAFPAALAARHLDEKAERAIWDGADLLGAALKRNPAIAEAEAKYRTAVAAAKAARVRPVATLTLTAEYSNEADHWLYGAVSDIPLDSGARRQGRLSAADLAVLQALYNYQDTVWTVRTALAKAQSNWLVFGIEVSAASALVAARQEQSIRLNRRVSAGEDARPAALAARTALGVAVRRLADAEYRADQNRIALAQALGVEPSEVQRISLAPLGSGPLPVTAAARQATALSRPDVLHAIADYDIAEGALRTEIARQYPEVHIGPGYTYDHGVRKIPFNLTLVLPPADLNRAAIAQAEARRAEAGRSLEAVQASVLAAVDQAKSVLASTRSALSIIRDQERPAAQAAEAAADRALAAGEADKVDQLAARAARLETELTLLDARKAAEVAAIDLEDALRTPNDPAERDLLQAAVKRLRDGS
jgi:cobalt-zinc-cadmium efflux system outer membrane protein